ncbi:hypothetical protein [Hymenobacter sp. UV11]|uniref:hypothetical protein n=1 Tax=Hymenobacter sp. UV11 TaxID=1849735 RepID=UPI001415140E|nr:hypothetical protein [Hymenobacter sp. UV11]
MRKLLLLLTLAWGLGSCALEKRFAEAPPKAKHQYHHVQRVHERERRRNGH